MSISVTCITKFRVCITGWNPHLLKDNKEIEDVQKYALRICCGQYQESYENLLDTSDSNSQKQKALSLPMYVPPSILSMSVCIYLISLKPSVSAKHSPSPSPMFRVPFSHSNSLRMCRVPFSHSNSLMSSFFHKPLEQLSLRSYYIR